MESFYIEEYFASLPDDIYTIDVSNKNLTYLPDISRFKNLQDMDCSYNQLTALPVLPRNLKWLFCGNNKLTSLPILPENLEEIDCSDNQLRYLPVLPTKIRRIEYYNNPVVDMMDTNTITQPKIIHTFMEIKTMKLKIKIWNRFRELFYTLKYKSRFRSWLWEKVRLQKIENQFHPSRLMKQLENEEVELDEVLVDWISEMP
jgi:hypothetical protein